jgi:hypothetical protein
MQRVKGYIPKKIIPPTPIEIMDGKLNALDEKLDTKIDDIKQEVKIISEDLKKKLEEELVYEVDEDKIVESVLSKIELPEPIKGEDGEDADQVDTDEIVKEVLNKIPKPKTIDEKELIKSILSKIKVPKVDEKALIKKVILSIPKNKASLKIIQEKFEVDPMSVIDKIMAMPDNKFKLKSSQISGLDQTIRAFQSQLGRGYLHGGGIGEAPKDGKQYVRKNGAWEEVTVASAFTDLTDVPNSYTGQGGKVVKVKTTEDGLEFGIGTDPATAGTITRTSDLVSSIALTKSLGTDNITVSRTGTLISNIVSVYNGITRTTSLTRDVNNKITSFNIT